MISVVIPSYKNPKYLDLCIKSALKTQVNKNEIIVVLDGYADLSNDVIEKYKDDISVLPFSENQGMSKAINYGVYNASNKYVLVVSEDNVFPKDWDAMLEETIQRNENINNTNFVLTPNQIEPNPGIYKFKTHNFGRSLEEFDLDYFIATEPKFREPRTTPDGSTFPFLISKHTFMSVGGFDIDYPTPFVVDWDFFLKLELSGANLERLHYLNFYHFISKSTKNRDGYIEAVNEKQAFFAGELKGAEYFEYKWGFKPSRDENNKCGQFVKF